MTLHSQFVHFLCNPGFVDEIHNDIIETIRSKNELANIDENSELIQAYTQKIQTLQQELECAEQIDSLYYDNELFYHSH